MHTHTLTLPADIQGFICTAFMNTSEPEAASYTLTGLENIADDIVSVSFEFDSITHLHASLETLFRRQGLQLQNLEVRSEAPLFSVKAAEDLLAG